VSVRVAVVDDEELGRRGVLARLAKHPELEVVAECETGREAVDAIRRLAPDLVFLDVQMPGLDGFGVLAELQAKERPRVVFVTAHDRHAIKAFEVAALDYVLKPIDDERFEAALSRALVSLKDAKDGELGRRVASLVASSAAASERYSVRLKGRTLLVKHAEIDWVGAEGDYVKIHAGARSWLVRDTLSNVERELGKRRFARIHRSTLVNVERVQEIRTEDDGDASLVLRDGTELAVGRTYRPALERLQG
jgi:two-component system LytT family response regulator